MAAGAPREPAGEAADAAPADAAADVAASLHRLHVNARAVLGSARDHVKGLRLLLAADLALARAALIRTLVAVALAVIFGGSTWLLLMAALIAALRALGLSWLAALLACALLSLIATAACALAATHYLAHSRLRATRRQLARLGLETLEELDTLLQRAASDTTDEAAPATAAGDHPHETGGTPSP
ncbi:phage holin family protein [Thermomonas alba]|uniref:phage holin family protein n=1 Tax=Thermomonas alba TaxID=2888525 RepID=UPI001F0462F3|nr:phage holin family protein [Thermomonas alba]